MNIRDIIVIGIAGVLCGCTHISKNAIIPDTPPDDAILSVSVLCWYEEEQSFAHVYITPDKMAILMDENEENIPVGESEEIQIDKQDLRSVYREIQNYIRLCDFEAKASQTNAQMSVYYGDEENKIELNRNIDIPLSTNPAEITKLITLCRSLEDKYKKTSNQILDPTWTTPVLKAEFISQEGHE